MSEIIEQTSDSEYINEDQEINQNINHKPDITYNPKTKNGKFKVECWHEEKNSKITPRDVNKTSHKYCWFSCDVCTHNFREKIINIMSKNMWCPYCSGKKLCDNEDCDICYENSFASA